MSWAPDSDETVLETYSRPGSGFRRFDAPAMGTTNVLLLEDPIDVAEPVDLVDAAATAFGLLELLESRLSKFLPSSEVGRLNQLRAGESLEVGPDFFALLELSREAWKLSDGAFDPTVGPLLDSWGLTHHKDGVPSSSELAAARAVVGMDRLEMDRATQTVRWRGPAGTLDLGGIAKGFAADRIRDAMQSREVQSGALVFGRSTIVVWGTPPGQEAWELEVVAPEAPDDCLCRLRIDSGVLSTSGNYERTVQIGSRTVGHVIDPRTGAPVDRARCATVWTPSATLGDVLATTLLVLGEDALTPGGAFDRLVEAWPSPHPEPCASAIVWVPDASTWGGLRRVERRVGPPSGYQELREHG